MFVDVTCGDRSWTDQFLYVDVAKNSSTAGETTKKSLGCKIADGVQKKTEIALCKGKSTKKNVLQGISSASAMSWFGFGGGGNKDNNEKSSYTPGSSYDATADGFGSSPDFSAPRTGLGVGGGGAGGSFEQELLLEQQKMLVQAVMFKLTESAFQKCVEKPSSSLSSSETSCIKAVVGKYLDTSELILTRMSSK